MTTAETDHQFNKIILDNVPASIITINKDGYITSANKYYQNFSRNKDYRNHNIFKSSFFVRENLTKEYKKLLADGTPVRRENCYEKNNRGEDKYFKIIAIPFRDKEGNIEGAISIGIDNSETILAKHELLELNNNLEKIVRQRTQELTKANNRLQEILNRKISFMSEVTHEFGNPLAIIRLELEMLEREKKSKIKGEFKETFEQISEEVKRMSTMLNDLSLLVNSDDIKQKLIYEKIDLNKLIASINKSIKIKADKKNIKITHKNSTAKIEILADLNMLTKLITNLLRNAIKYNKNDGWVTIGVKKTTNKIILKVEDSGMGISTKDLPHIFDRFYRGERVGANSTKGSGLGLSICKLITEMHKGTIGVTSKINKGSVFTVKLPAN